MKQILDYSAGYPGAPAVKNAGYAGVIRYLRKEGNSGVKPITSGEYQDMKNRGLDVAFVYQHVSKSRVTQGAVAGIHDAKWALDRLAEVTGGDIAPIYFAVDYDAPRKDWIYIAEYMVGAASVLGKHRVGTYGKWALLDFLFANDVMTYGWQTYAWSTGHNKDPNTYHPRAHLFQRLAQVTVGGIACDVNDVLKEDYGQLPRPTIPPPEVLQTEEDDEVKTLYMKGPSGSATFEHNGEPVRYSDLVFHVDTTAAGSARRHIHPDEWRAASAAGNVVTEVSFEYLDAIPGADGKPVVLFPWEKNTGGPLAVPQA